MVNNEQLGLNRSTAYIAGHIAGLNIDNSLTYQEIPGVQSITPEYSTAAGEMGAILLNLNIPFLKCRNRRLKKYYCVNSMLPDGLDLYINRVRDYVLNNIAAETLLGKRNTRLTENGAITLVEGLKQHYVNELELLKEYSIILSKLLNYKWAQLLEKFNFCPKIANKVNGISSPL